MDQMSYSQQESLFQNIQKDEAQTCLQSDETLDTLDQIEEGIKITFQPDFSWYTKRISGRSVASVGRRSTRPSPLVACAIDSFRRLSAVTVAFKPSAAGQSRPSAVQRAAAALVRPRLLVSNDLLEG